MIRSLTFCLLTASTLGVKAVETNGGTPPYQPVTSSTFGANYVGEVGTASGVYIGNGFVLTAAHVGAGNFTLGTTLYTLVPNSGRQVGTADLELFRIYGGPALAPLSLSTTQPTAFSPFTNGSPVLMLGYGGASGQSMPETYGQDMVTQVHQTITSISPYTSLDFETQDGAFSNIHGSVTNSAQLVLGDSGGGDFIQNSSGVWQLAGINEAELTNSNGALVGSAMIELSDYTSMINTLELADVVPEPSTYALLLIGGVGLLACARRARTAKVS